MDRTPTQTIPLLSWLDPRAHPLGDTWLLTIFTTLLALGLPRVASAMQVDFVACSLGLLALAVLHVGFTVVGARMAPGPGVRTRLLIALHLSSVLIVAFIWQRAGGLQNPLFLGVFVLPVIGAVFISRWQSYITAALSIVAVAVMGSGQVPAAAAWASAIGRLTGGADRPFAAFYAPAAYYSVALQVFAVVMFACAISAEYLRTLYDRLKVQGTTARTEALRSERLWSSLVEGLPFAAALIDVDSQEILAASAMALGKWGSQGRAIAGRQLFDVLQFSYPEPIEALIGGGGGVEPLSMVRLGGQLVATEVRVRHIEQSGRRTALVTVRDTTEALCVRAALDAAEHAALVVDACGCVLVLNRPARGLFPDAKVGSEVAELVPEAQATAWWDPGTSRCKRMHLTVARRAYRVTATAISLPGEEERIYVIAFVPVALVAGADRGATSLSAVMGQP
jgi:hypothetical protein